MARKWICPKCKTGEMHPGGAGGHNWYCELCGYTEHIPGSTPASALSNRTESDSSDPPPHTYSSSSSSSSAGCLGQLIVGAFVIYFLIRLFGG